MVIFLDNNNFKIDQNSINKLNEMMKNGNISDIISNIPPEIMQNIYYIVNNNRSSESNNKEKKNKNDNKNNLDFSNIDINTIMKMKNVIDKLNNNNDPRKNLLSSLKPYLRDSKKEKLDQYANLLNVAQIAELLKNDNKENNKNG